MLGKFRQEELVTFGDRMRYLAQCYPGLYIHVLKSYFENSQAMIEAYMQSCKTFENDPENYSLYVHGYFLPWLQ